MFKNIVLLFFALSASVSIAQGPPPDMDIDPERRAAVIEQAAVAIQRYHYDAERGAEIATFLRNELQRGAYDELDTALALTDRIGTDLDRYEDSHLNFAYFSDSTPLGFLDEQVIADEENERGGWRSQGFGIRRVERLDGNIGVLRIDRLPKPVFAGEALTDAMRLLDGTDALILDLRNNRGGDSDTITFVVSWFLQSEPIHLYDMVLREGVRQAWTMPWLPVRRYTAPVYVLTSERTYSGGEAIAFHLQNLGRAQVIGEATAGGSHPARFYIFDPNFAVQIPWARQRSIASGGDYERDGVQPDVIVSADDAFDTAYRSALGALVENSADDGERRTLQAILDGLGTER